MIALLAALVLQMPSWSGLPAGVPDLVAVDYPAKGGQVTQFDGPGTVTWLRPTKLPLAARADFDTVFLPMGYYGAWAMAPGGGYGYAAGTGTMDAAREIAMAQCLNANPACEIVAELYPADYEDPGPRALTLSAQMTEEFNLPGRGPFRAMAVSEDGAYAVVWDHPSQQSANAAARSDCAAQRLQIALGLRDMPCILVPGY